MTKRRMAKLLARKSMARQSGFGAQRMPELDLWCRVTLPTPIGQHRRGMWVYAEQCRADFKGYVLGPYNGKNGGAPKGRLRSALSEAHREEGAVVTAVSGVTEVDLGPEDGTPDAGRLRYEDVVVEAGVLTDGTVRIFSATAPDGEALLPAIRAHDAEVRASVWYAAVPFQAPSSEHDLMAEARFEFRGGIER